MKFIAHNKVSILDQELLEFLKVIASLVVKKFEFKLPLIRADQSYGSDTYAHYDYDKNEIGIRLKSCTEHIASNYYSIENLIDSLVHELAHAKTDSINDDHEVHGNTWQHWFKVMSDYVKKELM